MAMTDFMAMAMGVPCYGHDHAMFAGINMVMAAMILVNVEAKALSLAREMSLAKVTESG